MYLGKFDNMRSTVLCFSFPLWIPEELILVKAFWIQHKAGSDSDETVQSVQPAQEYFEGN